MNLGRLIAAWLVVVTWFGVATFASIFWMSRAAGIGAFISVRDLQWRLIEAGLVTLLASLWFDSLGSGGWWLLFALIGLLATVPQWFLSPNPLPSRATLIGASSDLVRYIVAGGLLAWRLS